MQTNGSEIMQGTVISTDPLKVQMTNDEKLITSERITIVPEHLSDYSVKAEFEGTEITLTVYNALSAGDTVYVLSLNNGKLYYILDRVKG